MVNAVLSVYCSTRTLNFLSISAINFFSIKVEVQWIPEGHKIETMSALNHFLLRLQKERIGIKEAKTSTRG